MIKAQFRITILFLLASFCCYAQRNINVPIAFPDSAIIIQPYADTINVTVNDISPSGDAFCLKMVYGSPFFTKVDCNNIAFKSDSSQFGNDTAWYVICNTVQPNMCDTAPLVVTVARHYTPMMLNNSRWITHAYFALCENDAGAPDYEVWTYYWTTDNVIMNGFVYKTIYSKQDIKYYPCPSAEFIHDSYGTPSIAGFIREDTLAKKVFLYGIDSDKLLYDFNSPIGDTLYSDAGDTSFISSIGYYFLGGNYYRSINISNYNNYLGWSIQPSGWIEGIGSTYGPLSTTFILFTSECLICFSTDGHQLYPDYGTDTCAFLPVDIPNVKTIETGIFPNPAGSFCMLRLTGDSKNISAAVFDMNGRKVQILFTNQTGSTFNLNVASLSAGVYFVKVNSAEGVVGMCKLVKQ